MQQRRAATAADKCVSILRKWQFALYRSVQRPDISRPPRRPLERSVTTDAAARAYLDHYLDRPHRFLGLAHQSLCGGLALPAQVDDAVISGESRGLLLASPNERRDVYYSL